MDDISNSFLLDALCLVNVLQCIELFRTLVLNDADLSEGVSRLRASDAGMAADLAKSALADGAVEVKVVEVDLAVEVDRVAAATEHRTHAGRC